jgi:lipid II:glycine glycyltransferase (peptidoglycan interpeptide bridge formation enzyme)
MPNSEWVVEVDRATQAEWSQMLDLFDDANIYQSWSYGAVRWGEKNLSHLVLKRGSEVVGMAQLRMVRPTRFKFGMAYLRWGPLFQRRGRPLDPEVATSMARALEREYTDKRKLFLWILPNAFVGSPRAEVMESAFCKFEREPLAADNIYRTFVVDLSPSLEELRKKLDPKWRNKLSGSEKKGHRVIAGRGSAEYRTFCLLYRQMRKRKAFETTVDVEEFGRTQEGLPESQRMQVLICEDNSVPVAGIVVSALGDSAIYLLGATSDDGLKSKGSYLLHWTMIKSLKDQGVKWYDLGGIDPEGNPGVYSFKKGFSGTEVTQLNPLVACDSKVSCTIVKAGLAVRRWLQTWRAALRLASAWS